MSTLPLFNDILVPESNIPSQEPKIEESSEKLFYPIFYRKNVHRRLAEITKIRNLSDLTEWPVDSVIHLINDNVMMDKPIELVPDINGWAMKTIPTRTYLMHITTPVKETFKKLDETFYLPPRGMFVTLTNFNKRNKKWCRPLNLEKIPKFPNIKFVFSYASLYRARIFGMQRETRRFNYVMTSLVNGLNLMKNYNQYIPIPVGSTQYQLKDFLPSFKVHNKITIKYAKDPWYQMMMHVVGFVKDDPTPSIFETIPESLWSKIHLVFYANDKMVIHTLANLKAWNKHDAILRRFINQLNMLAAYGSTPSVIDYSDVEPIVENTELEGEEPTADTPFDDYDRPVVKVEKSNDSVVNNQPISVPPANISGASQASDSEPEYAETDDDYKVVTVPELLDNECRLYHLKKVPAKSLPIEKTTTEFSKPVGGTPPKGVITAGAIQMKAAAKANLMDDIDDDQQSKLYEENKTRSTKATDDDIDEDPVEVDPDDETLVEESEIPEDSIAPTGDDEKKGPSIEAPTDAEKDDSAYEKKLEDLYKTIDTADDKVLTVDEKKLNETKDLNIPEFTKPMTDEHRQEFAKNTIHDIDEAATEVIESKQSLTPKQKERAKKLAVAYKSLRIDGQSIESLIKQPPEDSVSKNHLDFLKDHVSDDSMMDSSIGSFETDYMEKMFHRDLATELVSFNKLGMFLTDVEITDKSDWMNKVQEVKATYEDIDHKHHTIRFSLPKVDSRGYCTINGVTKVLKKQRCPNPICKVSPTRVTLQSDYNKYLVERDTAVAHSFISYIDKLLAKDDSVVTELATTVYNERVLPYEFTTIARKYSAFHIGADKDSAWHFYFKSLDHDDWLKSLGYTPAEIKNINSTAEELNAIFLGIGERDIACYMTVRSEVIIMNLTDGTIIDKSGDLIDTLCTIMDLGVSGFNEWVDFKLLNKAVPIGFALCYRYGFSYLLNYTNTKYFIVNKHARIKHRFSDVVLKFADKTMVIPRIPLTNSMIFAGLNNYDLSKINIEDMDSKDVYYDMLVSKKMSIHNIKGIDNFFDFFIDPITKEVLEQMGEPTNPKDLLIRATSLLTTEEHKPAASATNFRFRSYERVNAAIYKVLSRQLATYRNKGLGATNKFSVPEYEIQQLICTDQLMENVDTINPINDIKYQSEYGHGGFGGRESTDTFMVEDRQFTKDNIGIMSEATVDSGKTAYAASMSMNPTVVNMRGMTISEPPKDLTPSQLLSVTGVLMPGVTQDDGKRANFVSIHLSHYLPTDQCDVSRVRTGFEKVIAHRCHPPFAYCAEDDGVIEALDEKAQVLKVNYPKLKKSVAVSFGEDYTNNGGGGFYTTQNVVINGFKKGSKVKKGDVIVYNDRFFTADPYSKQVNWNIGVLTNTVLIDCDATMDDSCCLSRRAAEKLGFNPCHIRDIVLDINTTVHEFAAIGTEVKNIDPLMIFDQSNLGDDMFGKVDDETAKMIAQLNRRTPRAKFSGTVVKMEAYYRADPERMSPSIRSIVKKIENEHIAKARVAGNAHNADEFPKDMQIKDPKPRLGITEITDDNIVIRFYIKQNMSMEGGDKVEFDSSLKSVCTGVDDEPWETEDGSVSADALFSSIGINNRIICSPIITGIGNRVMEKLEQDILKMYFK